MLAEIGRFNTLSGEQEGTYDGMSSTMYVVVAHDEGRGSCSVRHKL